MVELIFHVGIYLDPFVDLLQCLQKPLFRVLDVPWYLRSPGRDFFSASEQIIKQQVLMRYFQKATTYLYLELFILSLWRLTFLKALARERTLSGLISSSSFFGAMSRVYETRELRHNIVNVPSSRVLYKITCLVIVPSYRRDCSLISIFLFNPKK